jgi:MFS family permease
MRRALLALTVRDFRWLWGGHIFFVISLVMSRLALGWLMLELTDSAYWVGLAIGLDGVGKIVVGVFAGVLIDRFDKRRVLLLSQGLFGGLCLMLGVLIINQTAALWLVLAVAFLLGGVDAIAAPANNAIVYQVVGRERVMNAAAINMFGFNLARTLGSALSGLVIDRWDTGVCYVVAGGAACAGLLPILMARGNFRSTVTHESLWATLRDGVAYVWNDRALLRVLSLSVVVEMFGFSHYTMISVIARDVLRVGAEGYGYLSAASGVGASLGTMVLAGLGDYRHKGRLLLTAVITAGVGIIAFAFSPWYAVSLLLAAINGATLSTYDAMMQTLVQLLTPDSMRGRVLSLYVLTFGFTSVGGYVVGLVATLLTVSLTISIGGGVITAYALSLIPVIRHLQSNVSEPSAAVS